MPGGRPTAQSQGTRPVTPRVRPDHQDTEHILPSRDSTTVDPSMSHPLRILRRRVPAADVSRVWRPGGGAVPGVRGPASSRARAPAAARRRLVPRPARLRRRRPGARRPAQVPQRPFVAPVPRRAPGRPRGRRRPAVDVVTWAPTTAARRRQRGFDQAELLARALARRLHVPCRRLLLRPPGNAQTGQPLDVRRAGPAFHPARPSPARGSSWSTTWSPAGPPWPPPPAPSGPPAPPRSTRWPPPAPPRVGAVPRRAYTPNVWPCVGLWLKVEASRRRNDPRKATRGC